MNRTEILNWSVDLINGERDAVYGTPKENHERIADLWSVVLQQKVYPQQVAVCMALVKVARLVNSPDHLDSYIDAAAYMAIAGEIATE